MYSPELAAFSWELKAADARTLQAGLRPNPDIEMEVENFGGTGETAAFGAAETTLLIGQQIELAGKRSKRETLVDLERDLSVWDYQAKRLDVITQVTKDFFEVLAAQKNVALQQDLVGVTEQVLTIATNLVEAGKAPP